MWNPANTERSLPQVLHSGDIHQERSAPADTMFTNTGRRLYVIGDIDGRFRLRSNPYDLYTFGKPLPDDPLADKLQGVWAQPVKGFNAYEFGLEWSDGRASERWELNDADRFTQTFTCATFDFQRAGLRATRRDFAPLDLPVLFSTLTLHNEGSQSLDLRLTFRAVFDLQDAWFTHLAGRRNAGQTVEIREQRLVALAEVLPEQWAAAVGSNCAPEDVRLRSDDTGEMIFSFHLGPSQEQEVTFAMSVVSEGGAAAALRYLAEALPRREALLAEKEAFYQQQRRSGPRLVSPDPWFNAAFELSQLNMLMLEADTGGLGRYYYAGLEMFPFWFGGDGAYSLPGLMASGLVELGLNHIAIGARFSEAGRIPHQISPSGRLVFSGSAQETPLWVTSVWNSYCWTGDRDFLARMYPAVIQGIFNYTLGTIDPDGDGYASGPGVVEREDMGEEKLDVAAYTWLALTCLANMAEVMQDAATAQQARAWSEKIKARFDDDWWDAGSGTYAMSLTKENRRYPVPHWAVVIPLEVGLATAEHAAATIATLRAGYLHEWGLKHTAGEDPRIWTLPTATLSRAAYRNGEPDLGYAMLRHVAETLDHGSIGVLHELIPQGACFVQLWSGATFIRGVVEDIFGISLRADRGEILVKPRLPLEWSSARLENLSFGPYTVDVEARPDGTTTVNWKRGKNS